ncbi:MAG: signal peptide peptidase SppA [Nitratireductor sp.]
MMQSVDEIVDRRLLRRRLTFWRVISIVLLVAALIAMISATGAFEKFSAKSFDHIARVKISGVITNDKPLLKLLKKLEEEEAVKAVVLDISSPGGSTVGGEAIYEAVRALSKEKPVATSVGSLAASAGYMIASASDHIVARRSSIVGSIGVIFQYADASKLLDKVGVSVNEIKSAPLKAEPSPFHPASDEAKAMIDRLVQDSYNWFVDIVAERRSMTNFQVKRLADGSIFTGSQGKENGLVDALGDEETARKWLVDEKQIDDSLEILSWSPVRPQDQIFANPAGLINGATSWLLGQLNLDEAGQTAKTIKEALPQRLFLDGLISMMQDR